MSDLDDALCQLCGTHHPDEPLACELPHARRTRRFNPGTRVAIALPEGLCLGTIVENVPSRGGYLVRLDGTSIPGGFGYNEVQTPAFDQGDRVRIMLPALGDLQVRTGVVIGPPRPNGYLVRLDQDGTSATLSRTCLDACPDTPWWDRLDWL